jgi:PAS domain S-box-containing protein
MSQVLDPNSTKRFWSAEYRFRRADGSYAYVANRGFVICDDCNKPIRMIGGITDITQRKQAEELLIDYSQTLKQQVAEQTLELAREKEFLQVIIDHIPVMITLYDAAGRVQFVNRELEQRLGWSSAELEEIDLLAVCCPDLKQRQQVLEHMLSDTGTWIDIKTYTKSNQCIDTSWTNIRLSNELNIGIGQDISDRELAEAASILEERNRMAREIHDTLAQAFTGILIQLGAATQVITDDLEATQAHLDMIDELARTGLTEARRSVSALRPQLLEEGNLSSALQRLVSQMRTATDTAVVYEVKGTAYSLPCEVEDNLLRMGQEALTNAIKYANADQIRIELVYENAQCILRVKDDGQGFKAGSVPPAGGFGLL